MNITLNDTEFEDAVKCYLGKIGFDTASYNVQVTVVQGRGGNGNRAECVLDPVGKPSNEMLDRNPDGDHPGPNLCDEIAQPDTTMIGGDSSADDEEAAAYMDEPVKKAPLKQKEQFGVLSFGAKK